MPVKVKNLSAKSFLCVCVCVVFLLELWRVSGAQDPLFLLTPSCKLPLFPCIPRHPSRSVQTGVGLHHMGLQTHYEECGWHRSADSVHAAAECGPGGGSRPKLLPDLFLWHPATHLLCGHRHVTHRRWVPAFSANNNPIVTFRAFHRYNWLLFRFYAVCMFNRIVLIRRSHQCCCHCCFETCVQAAPTCLMVMMLLANDSSFKKTLLFFTQVRT